MARVHILGAGTPTPTPDRFGSAFAVEVGGEYLMFDCGPAATHKLVKAGLWPTKVDYLFFTHHHFDHDVDYPCFLLCRWDQGAGKEKQLTVRGPRLTEQLTHRILDEEQGAFSHDWIARVNARLSQQVYANRGGVLPRRPPAVDVKDIGPGVIYTGKDWQVTAAPAEHVQPWLDSLAYRIDTPGGSIVITGDTQPCRSVIDLARNADILVSMCWDDQEAMEACGEASGSTGTAGAARMAQQAGVKALVLSHMGPRISSHGPLEKGLGDVRRLFDGRVIFAVELLTVDVRA